MPKLEKSGDSKLTDAAAAVAKTVDMSPEDLPKALPDILQASAEERKASGAISVEAYEKLTRQLEQLMSIVEKQNERLRSVEAVKGRAASSLANVVKCPTCRQGINSCKGEHAYVRILPSSPEFIRSFRGLNINGEVYYGYCYVPKHAASEWLAMVNIHEAKEREQMHNRGHIRGWTKDLELAEARRERSLNIVMTES